MAESKKEMKEVLVRYTETYGDSFYLSVPNDATQEEMEDAWNDALSNGDISLEKVQMLDSTYSFIPLGEKEKIEKKDETLRQLEGKLIDKTDFNLLRKQKEELVNAIMSGTAISNDTLVGIVNLLDLIGDIGEAAGKGGCDNAQN